MTSNELECDPAAYIFMLNGGNDTSATADTFWHRFLFCFREDVAPSADVVPLLFLKMLTRRGRVSPRRPAGADATAAHNDSHQCQCIKHRKQNIPVSPPFHRGNLINLNGTSSSSYLNCTFYSTMSF
jgi:hypothetical protein